MLSFIRKSEASFGPETIKILVDAFEDACAGMRASGMPVSQDEQAEREILARQIIRSASEGERDRRRLSENALRHLSRSDLKRSPRLAPV
jgi:hypothetical protein